MLKFFKIILLGLFHIFAVILLTLLSQVGGIIWILVFVTLQIIKPKMAFFLKFLCFVGFYLSCVFFVIPPLAAQWGKVPLPQSSKGNLIPHSAFYYIFNRNYVTPKTKEVLLRTAQKVNDTNLDLKLVYLDSSFPFSKEMPLPPHISHSSGKKVDLTFAYTKNGKLVNHGSSFTGYGNFEAPKKGEYDQPAKCIREGHHLYDYSKFAGFAKKDVTFDESNTKLIIEALLGNQETRRIIVETHIKQRLGITNERVRYAGCWAVRHDDHIHFQIR